MSEAVRIPEKYDPSSLWDTDGTYYPSEEKRKVPLTAAALRLIFYFYAALNEVFRGREDVFVGADQFIYWEPGDIKKRLAPDGYVLFGVSKLPLLPVVRTWRETIPAFVIEVSSKKSRKEDRVRKFALYQDVLKVPEYLLYDEDADELWLYRLENGVYVSQPADAQGRLHSVELGVSFAREPGLGVRLYSAKGEPIPSPDEMFMDREDARRRDEFLARVKARMEAEAEQLRQESAEIAAQLEAERQRADAERQRADALAAEVERLRRALEQSE